MAGRLKLLQFTQVVYEHIGIRSSQSNQHSRSINWRSVFMLYPPIQMTVCSLAFLLFEADNIVDAGTAFYVVDTEICCTFYYLALMWKKLKIQKLIDNFEKFVEKSEFLQCEGISFYFAILNQFNLNFNWNRNPKSGHIDQIQRTDWKYWKNVGTFALRSYEGYVYRTVCIRFGYNSYQLFHFRFGGRVILLTISTHVCPYLNTIVWEFVEKNLW